MFVCVCLREERAPACVNGAQLALSLAQLAHFVTEYVYIAAFDIRRDKNNGQRYEDLSMSIHS